MVNAAPPPEASNDGRARRAYETAAEVLGGLEKAFEDYERKNESAWER